MGDVAIRPMQAEDAAAAHELAGIAFEDEMQATLPAARLAAMVLAASKADTAPPITRANAPSRANRLREATQTDPGGCWVAEDQNGLAGVACAVRRGDLWVLCLLAVRPGAQGAGLGRKLLGQALLTRADATMGWVRSSPDPRALHVYQGAGFALHPAFEAIGAPHRVDGAGVREANLDDVGRVRALIQELRGVPPGPELDAVLAEGTARLLVTEGSLAGYALVMPGAVSSLGAVDEPTARAVLRAALARAGPEVAVRGLTAAHAWAIDTALEAGLRLWPGPTSCTWGAFAPPPTYIPHGSYG